MKHIVVTAGGTVEKIDEVRKITNMSTGMLSSLICKEIVNFLGEEEYTIHYIMCERAVKPDVEEGKMKIYSVSDTQSVMDTIDGIYEKQKVDYFVHAMAVSDFTTAYTIPLDLLAKEIAEKVVQVGDGQKEEKIREILAHPQDVLPKGQKISSKQDMILGLKRTPKVISHIKAKDPETYLVGFKLLNGVTEEYLREVASKLEEDNHCDLVVANDRQNINGEGHKAILVKSGCIIERFNTKRDIAKGIVNTMLGEKR